MVHVAVTKFASLDGVPARLILFVALDSLVDASEHLR